MAPRLSSSLTTSPTMMSLRMSLSWTSRSFSPRRLSAPSRRGTTENTSTGPGRARAPAFLRKRVADEERTLRDDGDRHRISFHETFQKAKIFRVVRCEYGGLDRLHVGF